MSGAKFELLFNQSQVSAVISELAATPAQVTKASNAAARHTLQAMSTLVAKAVSSASGIPVKALRSRLRVSRLSGPSPVWVLWVGLNNMPYDIAGRVSQTPTGLQHNKGVVKGGFYKGVFTKAPQGWIRKKRARALGLKLPGLGQGNPAVRFPDSNMESRFPVLRISHDLGQYAQAVVSEFEHKARQRFLVRFDHELRRIKGVL